MNEQELLENIQRLAEADTDNFAELAKMAGLNHKTDFDGADLSELDLKGIDFSNANLKGTDLSYVNLENANLTGANLKGCKF